MVHHGTELWGRQKLEDDFGFLPSLERLTYSQIIAIAISETPLFLFYPAEFITNVG